MKRSPIEQAERYSRQRASLLPACAILLIVQQGAFIAGGGGNGRYAMISGLTWMAMAAAMIMISATGGWYLVGKPVRDLMNDEATLAARRKSHSLGFINAMITAVLLYALTFLKDFSAREAIVVMTAVGLASALLSFGIMERRALGDE
jgi:hypothetical protein